MLRFLFIDLLWGGVRLAFTVALLIARPVTRLLVRAHAVFLRNVFSDRTSACGDPFAAMKSTRRS